MESLQNFVICEDLNICLKQLTRNRELAVAISREYVRHSRLNNQIFCIEKSDVIYDYALKFLVRKNFQYLNELNIFIRMASTRGLVEKWHSEGRIRYQKKFNENIYNYINNDSYKGTWLVYFMLLGTIFFILYCERLIHKKTHEPNPRRFWLIAEMMIDPFRHFWLKTKLLNGNVTF